MVSSFFSSFFLVISFIKQSRFTEAFLTLSGFYILASDNEHLFIKVMIKIHAFHILKFYSEIDINISGVVYRKTEYILPVLPLSLCLFPSPPLLSLYLSLFFILPFSFLSHSSCSCSFLFLLPSFSPLPHLVYVLLLNLMNPLFQSPLLIIDNFAFYSQFYHIAHLKALSSAHIYSLLIFELNICRFLSYSWLPLSQGIYLL